MELIKYSEAYNLTDITDNWVSSGTVIKENSGELRINLSTALKLENDEQDHLGSMYYSSHATSGVNVNYNFPGEYKEAFVDYCESLVDNVLKQVLNK